MSPCYSFFPVKEPFRQFNGAHHSRHCEFAALHLLRQDIDLSPGVAEDDSLGDIDSVINVAKGIELPALLLHSDVELFDTFQGQLVLFDEDSNGIAHELGRNIQHLRRHGSREQGYLDVVRQELERIIDLCSKSLREHLVCFVNAEDLHRAGFEHPTPDDVENTTRSADDNLNAITELGHIIADASTTHTRQTGYICVVSKCDDDCVDLRGELAGRGKDNRLRLLEADIDFLQKRHSKSSSLSCARLGLGYDILAICDWGDGALLDRRGSFES